MLNDVHAPPLEKDHASTAADRRPPGATRAHEFDRARRLEQAADHHGGTSLVFSDPEDRGDSFNTTMSAIIVGSVLVTLAIVAWLMWK